MKFRGLVIATLVALVSTAWAARVDPSQGPTHVATKSGGPGPDGPFVINGTPPVLTWPDGHEYRKIDTGWYRYDGPPVKEVIFHDNGSGKQYEAGPTSQGSYGTWN